VGVAISLAIGAGQNNSPSKDLPYVAVHHSEFISAAEAGFLGDADRLIGVVEGKVAKAYPAAILAQHGVVQDRLETGPIAVTWCSYCNTALVFRAEAKGQPLEFDSDGVIGSNEVFKDRQTGSRWRQSILEAISGPLRGEHLQLFPFLLTNWHEWRRLHSDTLVLSRWYRLRSATSRRRPVYFVQCWPVHFGLGPDATIDRVEIRWLSGTVQLRNLKAHRVTTVTEPD
jgi:Protein of unknown function (DUF3179)/ASPIC and UnbV